MSSRYKKSEIMLEKALKLIPLGSQTFSKSKTQYPHGVSPYFIARGKGSHVWDVDGNEYIDFVSGLASLTLGYCDPDVTAAVQTQLESGSIFSLPHPIEIEVAEKIVEMVPCAEMVRFGKNGSDVTAGAVRLARAYTHRERVAVCGYHGWQDWYIGSTTRNQGVPAAVCQLTHIFQYNNLDSLEILFKHYPNEIAAVVMEPMCGTYPQDGYLASVKSLAHKHGALLIFDEVVTGFRYSKGGAQEYFGVTPDLAAFGKGLANGYPVSAIAGRADVMKLMEEIFFSFTFGGEALSLAAAAATLNKLQTQPVVETLIKQGTKVIEGVKKLIVKHNVSDFMDIVGFPTCPALVIKDTEKYSQWEIRTLLLQELFERGILFIGTHNINYSHTDQDIEILLKTYDEVFQILFDAVSNNRLKDCLKCDPLIPLFKIR